LTEARNARILLSVFQVFCGFVCCLHHSSYIYITDSKQWNSSFLNGKAPGNIVRWYNFIKSLGHVETFLASIPDEAKPKLGVADQVVCGSVRKEEGKFVELPGAEVGKVVVRFPPEASG
jgi:bifunctional glutamyl/prolyl-tRNA synthetase